MEEDQHTVERARVSGGQMPIFCCDLRSLAAELRVDWSVARQLWSDGLLSFDPDGTRTVDEAGEAEFRFVAALASTGTPGPVIARMLRGLRKPYAYDLRRIFFDWTVHRWRMLPGEDDPQSVFFALVGRLEERQERQVLLDIRELLDDALDLARDRRHQFQHEAPTGGGARFVSRHTRNS